VLDPKHRLLLLDALRPPDGYRFDEGIGTTFSLDLLALLTAPVAFTLFEIEDPTHSAASDSMEVLHSARQHAERLTIFCQSTRISVPKRHLPQFAFVERCIVECRKPGGLFHPKLWALRFVNDAGEVVYRVLCLTRNLTFANSWDTALVLDATPGPRPIGRNRPLADFIAALPTLAKEPSPDVVARANRLAEQLRYAPFSLPDGVSDLRFWPIGLDDRPVWPFSRLGKRLLVISPFVTDGCLERLGRASGDAVLVSTREDLKRLGARPNGFKSFNILHEAAVAEFLDEEAADRDTETRRLSGLHAKCYVTENGSEATVWTGSANATDAAFSTNVEFLVELTGPRRRLGLDAVLAQVKDELRFGNLLEDGSGLVATEPLDADMEALRSRLEEARAILGDAGLRGVATPSGQGWDLTVRGRLEKPLPAGITAWGWPMPAPGRKQLVGAGQDLGLQFPDLSFESLSPFLSIRLEALVGRLQDDCQFLLMVPLDGLPADRQERVLRSLVKDRAALMRFLYLLLAEEGHALVSTNGTSLGADGKDESWRWYGGSQPGLFELLVRALSSRPQRIDEVARLIDDIRAGGRETEMLPPGFFDIWAPIWATRQEDVRVQADR
jgi:hypothetical protein